MGHSWGTIIALTVASTRPDLLWCYVGVGQVTSGPENERLSFDYGKRRAVAEGNAEALAELAELEPYPGDEPLNRDRVVMARKWPQHFGGLSAYRNDSGYFFQAGSLSPLYSAEDLDAVETGSMFTLDRVLSLVLTFDVTELTELAVPVIEFLGRHDWTTPTEPTLRWLRQLSAPSTRAVWFEHSAHLCMIEEPGKFTVSLVDHVLPLCR